MDDCLFCKIQKKEIPADLVYEDENVIGFEDINPQAKIHLLFIHREHTKNINDLMNNKSEQIGQIFKAIQKYTSENKLEEGFRALTNCGATAGQSVFHTHFHVLSGERLGRFGS